MSEIENKNQKEKVEETLASAEDTAQHQGDTGSEEQEKQKSRDVKLPPASFTSLVMMLSTTALGYMEDIAKAETEKKNLLLQLARHTIDTIQVLDDKTKNNLEKDERELIDRVLAELRLQFIKYAN